MDRDLAVMMYLSKKFFSNIDGREYLRRCWLPTMRELHFKPCEIEYTQEEAEQFYTIDSATLKALK